MDYTLTYRDLGTLLRGSPESIIGYPTGHPTPVIQHVIQHPWSNTCHPTFTAQQSACTTSGVTNITESYGEHVSKFTLGIAPHSLGPRCCHSGKGLEFVSSFMIFREWPWMVVPKRCLNRLIFLRRIQYIIEYINVAVIWATTGVENPYEEVVMPS